MSTKISSKQSKVSFYGEKAKGCSTDSQKIDFFDSFQDAFFTESPEFILSSHKNIPKEIDDAFYVFANMKKMNEKELEIFKNHNWIDFPDIFKIFLFDFCIFNGDVYSKYFLDKKEF